MKILAIDTSTEACSAALLIDNEISSRYQLAPREHSRLILKNVEQLLADAEINLNSLDAIAFGRGPGSFMGLRIAAGVVQGIAFANDTPVIPISTLKAIAQRANDQTGNENILAAIDARMDEVYWGAYSLVNGHWKIDGEECVISPDAIHLPSSLSGDEQSWVAAGSGWASYSDRLLKNSDAGSVSSFKPAEIITDCFPSAEVMAKLAVPEFKTGNMIAAEQAIPVYIRNNVAKKPKTATL